MKLISIIFGFFFCLFCFVSPAETATLTSRDYFEQGMKSVQKGDLSAALDLFRKAIQLDPSNDDAWKSYDSTVKEAAKLIGDLTQVKESLKKAIQKDPLNDHVWGAYDYLVNTMTQLEVGISTRGVGGIEGRVTYYLSEYTPQKADVGAAIFVYKGDLGTLPFTDDPNFMDKYPAPLKSLTIGISGEYKITDLAPGKYTIVIRSDGKKGPNQFQKGLVVQKTVMIKAGMLVNVSNHFGSGGSGPGGAPPLPGGEGPRGY